MATPEIRSDTGYVGGIASISAADVPALYVGSKFFSPGAGDAYRTSMITWLTALLQRNGPVALHRVESLDPGVHCISLCVIGSASAMADLPPSGDEFLGAVRRLEHFQRVRMGAVYPLAAATVSAMMPVAAASQLGVPLLDADGMGRTYALIHHTAMHLGGLSPTPLVVQGPTGESVLIDVDFGPRADRLLRGNVDTLGGWAALASYPTTAGALRRASLPGTVSRLINVGRLLLDSHDPDLLVSRLAAVTGSWRLARGRIVEMEHLSRPNDVTIPAHPSSMVIEEIGDAGRQLRLELRSEIVAAFADGALIAGVPDLLCLLDVSRGEVTSLDSVEPGDLVDVLVTPVEAIWYTAEANAMVGLASHDIRLDHPRSRAGGR
jgi:uncharacterized protein